VLLIQTGLPPRDLLDAIHGIEAGFGRVRAERFGPRTLDIDIIGYAGQVSDDPELTLPHPRAHERAFVLVPWHDIDPGAELPGYGPVAGLLAGLARSGVRPVPGAVLTGAPS
jgi:2-amino-4-hydroxy-6-hydroxymethyldihydropteridine diphosphokinase